MNILQFNSSLTSYQLTDIRNNWWSKSNKGLPALLISPTGLYMYAIESNGQKQYNYLASDGVRVTTQVHIFVNNKKFITKQNQRVARVESTLGKDVFLSCITLYGKVSPSASSYIGGSAYSCSNSDCATGSTAYRANDGCLNKIISDGWKINYY